MGTLTVKADTTITESRPTAIKSWMMLPIGSKRSIQECTSVFMSSMIRSPREGSNPPISC